MRLRLEQIQRDFLQGEGNFERKHHLVKWPTVCKNKIQAGPGVRRLASLNKAFISKWIWRFAMERELFEA